MSGWLRDLELRTDDNTGSLTAGGVSGIKDNSKVMPSKEEVEVVVKRPIILGVITGCAFFFGGYVYQSK